MSQQSHIVSFDDARRFARDRRLASGGENGSPRSAAPRSPRSPHIETSPRKTRPGERDLHSPRKAAGIAPAGGEARRRQTTWNYDLFLSEGRTSRRSTANRTRHVSEPEPQVEDAPRPEQPSSRASLSEQLQSKVSNARRTRNKEKADKRFTKQYGGAGMPSANAEPAGPRAAVYKGEMGTQHRKAARMQGVFTGAGAGILGFGAGLGAGIGALFGGQRSADDPAAPKRRAIPKALVALLAVLIVLAGGFAFLFEPAKQCYTEGRKYDQLLAEYAAVQEHNEIIRSEVEFLSTKNGVEDRAREEFGWVKSDEQAGRVAGVEVEEDSTFAANVVPGSVPAPETWYSGVLDPLFGVE